MMFGEITFYFCKDQCRYSRKTWMNCCLSHKRHIRNIIKKKKWQVNNVSIMKSKNVSCHITNSSRSAFCSRVRFILYFNDSVVEPQPLKMYVWWHLLPLPIDLAIPSMPFIYADEDLNPGACNSNIPEFNFHRHS